MEECELEEQQIKEAEKWEQSFQYIPDDLHQIYAPLLAEFTLVLRISVYKRLDLLKWDRNQCIQMYNAITRAKSSKIEHLIEIMNDEFNNMLDIMTELSISEVLNILDRCNEPMAKHCKLCRSKRMQALEYRMLHNDTPNNM
eukprot:gene14541-30952_t